MKESYSKGVASHAGPESCLDDPRGRGEALTRESAGGLLSSEITLFREPRRCPVIEGNMGNRVTMRERLFARRSQRTWHAWTLSARESRDLGKEPAWA
jgi:RNA-directed DNA polymerase